MRLFVGRCRLTVLCLLVAAGFFLAFTPACHRRQKHKEQITYQLKWLFNISVVGDLYANARGYFAEQGLTVDIKPGSPERDAIKELEVGRAQFGVASADQVIRAVAKGSPIVVIAQLFQANPLQWIYRANNEEIDRPEALKGKVIGITYGGNDETIMKGLLAKYGIPDSEVTYYSVRYDYTPFYQHRVDLWPVYRNAEGIVISDKLKAAGESARFFNPDAYGVRFVANSVITTRQMLDENPHVVARFTAALLRGWGESLVTANAETALNIWQQFDRDTPVEILREQLNATRQLMTEPGTAFGAIDVPAWQQTEQIMLDQGLIEVPVDITSRLQSVTVISGK